MIIHVLIYTCTVDFNKNMTSFIPLEANLYSKLAISVKNTVPGIPNFKEILSLHIFKFVEPCMYSLEVPPWLAPRGEFLKF